MLWGAHQNVCALPILRNAVLFTSKIEMKMSGAERPFYCITKEKIIFVFSFFWKIPRGFDQRKLLLQ